MENAASFFLTVGGILLLGLLTSGLARFAFLPRVTLLLIFGAIIGPYGLDLIPVFFLQYFDIVAAMTLLMVGFLLGGKLNIKLLSHFASAVIWIAITAALVTAALVSAGLMLLGLAPAIAIILGCIASATAPAAILDVVDELDCDTPFSRLLLAVVAFDDIVALVLFAVGIASVQAIEGEGYHYDSLLHAVYDLGGAVILGAIIGIPAALVTGRLKRGKPILTEALALVFICGGLAIYADVSYLVASMVMGAIIVNTATHHDYPFHAIDGIESLFMVIFFVLAGASLDFLSLQKIGWIGAMFVLARIAGKFWGARLGAQISHSEPGVKKWMGLAMLPQAGVPIGMALVAATEFPEHRQILLSVVISATVIFEIIGPVLTRLSLRKTSADQTSA